MFFDALIGLLVAPILTGATLENKYDQYITQKDNDARNLALNKWRTSTSDNDLERRIRNEYYIKRRSVVDKVYHYVSAASSKHDDFFMKHHDAPNVCTAVLMAKEGKVTSIKRASCLTKEQAICIYYVYKWVYEEELPRHGRNAPGFAVAITTSYAGGYEVYVYEDLLPHSRIFTEYQQAKNSGKIYYG